MIKNKTVSNFFDNIFIFSILRLIILPLCVFLTFSFFYIIAQWTKIPNGLTNLYLITAIVFISLEILILVFYFFKELFFLHKTMRFVRRNISLTILLLYSTMVYTLYDQYLADEFMYEEFSPDGAYSLDVYAERSLFAMPGHGGGCSYSRSAKVVLKNSWGLKIGETNENCTVACADVEIVWDLDEKMVWFTRGARFNLETGRCDD
jgi:hypothetical protein